MKYFSILMQLILMISCNQKIIKSTESIKEEIQALGEPTCSMYSEFGGHSLIYTNVNECGCGPNVGFFGTYWNLTCDKEEDKQKINHVNFIGDLKKWGLLKNFLESRSENEGKELFRLTNLILISYKDNSNPFLYYDNIKKANDYLMNLKSESFREAFTSFYSNSFKN